jgi:3,4-dihydroxy 2-butanone 4-phosphate synthase/GTP cyclohydrolase II
MARGSVSGDVVELHLNSIDEALDAIADGECIVVMDDRNRENEGDLIMAAEHATAEALAFIVRHSTGIVCVAIEGRQADALDLPPMVPVNSDSMGTAFTVTVDCRHGVSTGVSAADRARTIRTLGNPDATPDSLTRPGHVFPLRARPGGVLERPGHTEAAVDLMRLAGCFPAGVLCEVTNDDGTMSRLPDLLDFAQRHKLKIITIADLIRYRLERESAGRRWFAADDAHDRVIPIDAVKASAGAR